jgi:hypothetical protein
MLGPAVSMRPRSPNFAIGYLKYTGFGEFEAICEPALARESGPWGDCSMKKKPMVENLVSLSI